MHQARKGAAHSLDQLLDERTFLMRRYRGRKNGCCKNANLSSFLSSWQPLLPVVRPSIVLGFCAALFAPSHTR